MEFLIEHLNAIVAIRFVWGIIGVVYSSNLFVPILSLYGDGLLKSLKCICTNIHDTMRRYNWFGKGLTIIYWVLILSELIFMFLVFLLVYGAIRLVDVLQKLMTK